MELAHQLKRNWRQADLSDRHRTMLAYVEKLTVNPSAMERADLDALRAAGFSDRDCYDIVVLTASFNFITRVADAFGVQLDDMIAGMLDSMGEGQVFAPKS